MKTRLLLALVLVLIAATAVVWILHWVRHRDERQIQKTLTTLVEQVSKDGAESEIVSLAHASMAASCFSESLHIAVFEPLNREIGDLDVLRGLIHHGRLSFDRIRIRLLERALEIDSGGERARMTAAARVTVSQGGNEGDDIFRLALYWIKEDGAWRIREVRPDDTIRPPPAQRRTRSS